MEEVNHEYYVSPEVANLLEKAWFDWACRKCYNNGVLFDMEADEIRAQVPQHSSYDVLAPTLEVVQRWLREVKDLSIEISSEKNLALQNWYMYTIVNHIGEKVTSDENNLYNYEEAQESGIKKALEIILEKDE